MFFFVLFVVVVDDSAGFEVKVVASDNYIKADSGLIYRDFDVGQGECPKDGQQVHYLKARSNPRKTRIGYV